MDFPKTITRELLVEKGACEEGLKAFDAAYPSGSIHYSKSVHRRWLRENLFFEAWAVSRGVCAPLEDEVGDYGTAQAGYAGTAQASRHGTATTGRHGTARAGEGGAAQAGEGGTATAGYGGILRISYWDGRWRRAVAYVGEDGILPDTSYRLDENYNFVPA